jgi:protein involved in polysaccharide export with SLBB domain
VFVTGEVQRPGRYPLKADRSLLTLVGDIGAFSANVGHEVIVIRPPSLVAGGGAPAVDPLETPPANSSSSSSGGAPGDSATPPSAVPGLPFAAPGSEIFHISLLELQSGNPEKNLVLKAGDTVYFPKASQVYVMGSVARPGPVHYQEGMTVLQALTLAGGVTDRGSQGRAKIVRVVDGKKVEKKAKPTDIVQPEDTLVVPERFF